MKKTTLKSNLSVDGITKIKQYFELYQKELNRKNVVFVRELAKLGIPIIDSNMAKAQGDSNPAHNTVIELTAGTTYSRAVLKVSGEDLLFIEFGAGVHYNGSAGRSPHPKGKEFGYSIGGYGQGKGSQDSWTYEAPTGEWIRSYGTKATMPVYVASQRMRAQIKAVAKRVFTSEA